MAVDFARVGAHQRVRLQIIGTAGVAIEGNHYSDGDIAECSSSDAIFLVGRGIAKRISAPPAPVTPALAPEPQAETKTEPVKEETAAPKKPKNPVAVGK